MASTIQIPRIVVAGAASGVGKTTVTVALIGALRARGLRVAAFKCGPDYLDPTYHERALGAPSHNLDGWMMGRDAVVGTFARIARDADVAVVEGMMGLYDGIAPDSDEGSSAEIAKWLGAPVLLVVDASGMARTIAALAKGYAEFDREVRVAGVVANRVGGRGHLDLLRASCGEIPIVGGFPADAELTFPERHLGLFAATAAAVPQKVFERWSAIAREWLDLDAIVGIARSAPALEIADESAKSRTRSRARIGIAHDEAFHFYYDDNLRRLESLGAELIRFSPVRDETLPEVDGIYIGGGYPEVEAERLSSNAPMIAAIRAFAANRGPVYGECGGLMYLAQSIKTLDGRAWPMAGLVPGEVSMVERLQALGYVEVETRAPSILGAVGLRFRGHQFRYSVLEIPNERPIARLYWVKSRWGGVEFEEGYSVANVLASYVHAHWASNPAAAQGFVESCARWRSEHR
jgi:cobyrinic acid a,c-diamide synthase